MNPLVLVGALALFFLLRKKPPVVVDNTTPDVVPFTAANVNAYKNENTRSLFDRRLASSARRVTPDGTGKAIVDGSYKCFAPGNQTRRNAIIKVYEDLDRLQTRINNSTGERREEARRDKIEKDNERAILVAEHYMICEAFFEELKKKSKTPTQTTVTTAQQERGTL
jgi:glutathionyl-hydroquinone reductase